ncbi:hypothetical protein BDZ89DRAFT_1069475 [Hymenopellis radicata]|nr:hypothetical protein BDZ89DRAFT_1069475 [Hymenopellis radicata]
MVPRMHHVCVGFVLIGLLGLVVQLVLSPPLPLLDHLLRRPPTTTTIPARTIIHITTTLRYDNHLPRLCCTTICMPRRHSHYDTVALPEYLPGSCTHNDDTMMVQRRLQHNDSPAVFVRVIFTGRRRFPP